MADYSDIRYVATGVTEYATVDNLPTSGNSTGDQAFVTGTNRLYIWNGTGWYNIALINTTPSISGASSAYTLASDGTATTVTITATDPEGLPITYSIASDTSGNIATVSQGTGANTNVFTITPSTNAANAGTFSLTFRASDGVNIATAVSEFTLVFSIENSNYTTALITSVGANNADNNDFVDSSTNTHTITANGDVTQNTFSPYRHIGYSAYFDGSGDYLDPSSSTNTTNFGTGDFTCEFWYYPNVSGTQQNILDNFGNAQVAIYRNSSNILNYYIAGDRISSTTALVAGAWYHVALVRSSGTSKLYINGVQEGSNYSDTTNFSGGSTYPRIGSSYANTVGVNGYVSDLRIVKGTAVYTSNFTPPTERLTAITNTSLLTCHLPYIADGSTNDYTIGVAGNVSTQPFTPYEHTIYTDTDDGGSIKLSASGDYVGFSNSTDFDFTGDFTIAAWVYRTGSTGYDSIIAITDAGNDGLCSIGTDRLLLRTSGGGAIVDNSSYTIPTNRWTHVALTRSGSDIKLFLNGTVVVSATS